MRRRRESSSHLCGGPVFGRGEEKEEIVRSLLLESEDCHGFELPVVAIVGMGGIGKTTLAQLVYNDSRVSEHFGLKMWVWASDDFDVKRMTREILEYVEMEENCGSVLNLNKLQENLAGKLRGKRYLLVLDDVWNENRVDWQKLSAPLHHGERGSKVLVTARNENVAAVMHAVKLVSPRGLPFEDCWSLFKTCAFVGGNSESHPKLEEVGKNTVKKLKGVPLAVKKIGDALYSKLEEWRWKIVSESETWELWNGECDVLSTLRSSYQHLPAHLKQCFAYCSVFPKGHMFDKLKLVQIWMALGFIQTQAEERMEDVGSNYFDNLLCRNFFQHSEGSYVMHDLIHDLAMSVSMDECFRITNSKSFRIFKEDHKMRHLSFSISTNLKNLYKFKTLRSLINLHQLNQYSALYKIPPELSTNLKLLRVLDLSHFGLLNVPESIGHLKHLRYLDLSYNDVKGLPESLTSLYNLQTLELRENIGLTKLPISMSKLINLRHLSGNGKLVSTIAYIGKLSYLQELETFCVANKSGYKIGELKDLTELHGKLCVQNLENVESGEEAIKTGLQNKKHLDTLELEWSDNWDAGQKKYRLEENVLEGLQPPPEIKRLTVRCSGGFWFPRWMEDNSLSFLEHLCLHNCRKWEALPPLGQLPYLKSLRIGGMGSVKKVDQEFSGRCRVGFPLLEEMEFYEMLEWEEWLREEGELFPCLHTLCMSDCPKLRQLPLLPTSLVKLSISNVGVNVLPGSLECHGMMLPQLNVLEVLTVSDCKKLTFLPLEFAAPDCIKELTIKNCPKLMSLQDGSGLSLSSSLESFCLEGCPGILNESLFIKLQNLTSLSQLSVTKDYANLTSCIKEALHHFSRLTGLHIYYHEQAMTSGEATCVSLTYDLSPNSLHTLEAGDGECHPVVDLNIMRPSVDSLNSNCDNHDDYLLWACLKNHLNSVRCLSISRCPNTSSLLGEVLPHLTILVTLKISSCKDLTSLAYLQQQELMSLKNLEIYDCPGLTILCEGTLCHLTALKALYLGHCENVKHLPVELQSLPCLKSLRMEHCPQIQFLPEKGLPISLEQLYIKGCPVLEERCQNIHGIDWPKIAHVPTICIEMGSDQRTDS